MIIHSLAALFASSNVTSESTFPTTIAPSFIGNCPEI
ncbi:uncharacterized protein METZ01_LOCUS268717 [marine metagenome]|uniref:Uncharacterized protein n=1 Tax=marine metagenome TaxID=408172 RepID=A0A382JXA2_9ZZZZ